MEPFRSERGGARPPGTVPMSKWQNDKTQGYKHNYADKENRFGQNKCKHCNKKHRGACKYMNYNCNLCKKRGHLKTCPDRLNVNCLDVDFVEPMSVQISSNNRLNPRTAEVGSGRRGIAHRKQPLWYTVGGCP